MISVIIVTYNSKAVLPACISSLEQCTFASNLEIILVDNASTDGTWVWIRDYAEKNKNELCFNSIKTIYLEENKGYAFANNRGLEISAGDFLLLLNPDTIIGKNTIGICLDRLNQDHMIGAIGCRLELSDQKIDLACKRSFPTFWNSFAKFIGLSRLFPKSILFASYNLTFLEEKGSYYVDCLCGAFMMVPRVIYKTIGGLDEDYFMYGEDIDWCYRIKHAGYKVWYEGTVTTIHIKGGNGGKRSVESLRHFYSTMLIYFQKHHAMKFPYIFEISLHALLRILFYVHVLRQKIREQQ